VKVFVYGDTSQKIVGATAEMLRGEGIERVAMPDGCDVAVAPLLRMKLSDEALALPRHGTLIFHPSLLPRHRGPDAIRWTFDSGEKFSGFTWFWADAGYDTGPVCEQCVVELRPEETPRQFYERMIPLAVEYLRFALHDLRAGYERRRPQNHVAATCEGKFNRQIIPAASKPFCR
jgi:methionyl-tRNA formyltransferase